MVLRGDEAPGGYLKAGEVALHLLTGQVRHKVSIFLFFVKVPFVYIVFQRTSKFKQVQGLLGLKGNIPNWVKYHLLGVINPQVRIFHLIGYHWFFSSDSL